MIKFLIGGSPCTHWSIAQNKARETEPEGIGWELFKNYLIAKEKFQPDFFLYENNKSAAQAIKDRISEELEVPLQYINSALVSAQNRWRFYAHNIPGVEQPEDRHIMLADILESGICDREKSTCLLGTYDHAGVRNYLKKNHGQMVFEPVLAIMPPGAVCVAQRGRYTREDGGAEQHFEAQESGKSNALTTVQKDNMVAQPILFEPPPAETDFDYIISTQNGKKLKVYKVIDGKIGIKGKKHPVKLPDGFYIIRPLTVTECCRLQTLPDNYCWMAKKTHAYRGLGNGWTAEIIIHILSYALAGIPKDEEIVVLSMYDGIGTGRYCFDKLGYKNIRYFSYEIEKSAMEIASTNFPDIAQCGDAFQVRENGWGLQI